MIEKALELRESIKYAFEQGLTLDASQDDLLAIDYLLGEVEEYHEFKNKEPEEAEEESEEPTGTLDSAKRLVRMIKRKQTSGNSWLPNKEAVDLLEWMLYRREQLDADAPAGPVRHCFVWIVSYKKNVYSTERKLRIITDRKDFGLAEQVAEKAIEEQEKWDASEYTIDSLRISKEAFYLPEGGKLT